MNPGLPQYELKRDAIYIYSRTRKRIYINKYLAYIIVGKVETPQMSTISRMSE